VIIIQRKLLSVIWNFA